MRTIYVVRAATECDCGIEYILIKAFTTKAAANQLVRQWTAAAPAGFEECDYFVIEPLELEDK